MGISGRPRDVERWFHKVFCIDYRRLNEVTKKDSYSAENWWYPQCTIWIGLTLDLENGFWQMEEVDREKTAFTAGNGFWQYSCPMLRHLRASDGEPTGRPAVPDLFRWRNSARQDLWLGTANADTNLLTLPSVPPEAESWEMRTIST